MITTVQYADYRREIKTGDVLAWSHRSWRTWYDIKTQIVRIVTRSEYCHVGTAWVYAGRVFVIEAVEPVIRIVPLSNLGEFYHIPMNVSWRDGIENYAMSLVGIGKYSYKEAALSVLGIKTEVIREENWQCAKLVKTLLTATNVHLECVNTPSAVVRELQIREHEIFLVEA
jgi:hypothetical protein